MPTKEATIRNCMFDFDGGAITITTTITGQFPESANHALDHVLEEVYSLAIQLTCLAGSIKQHPASDNVPSTVQEEMKLTIHGLKISFRVEVALNFSINDEITEETLQGLLQDVVTVFTLKATKHLIVKDSSRGPRQSRDFFDLPDGIKVMGLSDLDDLPGPLADLFGGLFGGMSAQEDEQQDVPVG